MKKFKQMKKETFGKDHWSLLGFIYTQVVDKKNLLDLRRMRVNEKKRGFTNGLSLSGSGWQPTYGTKIKGGTITDPTHDDIDCLNDLQEAGYIENTFTDLNPIVVMTKSGFSVAEKLNRHKANGGTFSTFEI